MPCPKEPEFTYRRHSHKRLETMSARHLPFASVLVFKRISSEAPPHSLIPPFMPPKTQDADCVEPKLFVKCPIHPDSSTPCVPTPGWRIHSKCPRAFIEHWDDEKKLFFDVHLAGYLELILEGRPNHALQELDNYIADKRSGIDEDRQDFDTNVSLLPLFLPPS